MFSREQATESVRAAGVMCPMSDVTEIQHRPVSLPARHASWRQASWICRVHLSLLFQRANQGRCKHSPVEPRTAAIQSTVRESFLRGSGLKVNRSLDKGRM